VEKYTPLAAEFGPEGKHFVSVNIRFFIFVGAAKRGNEPKKTGARSARARTRGQNPLVLTESLPLFSKHMHGFSDCIE
jgi:hypothetical protein